MFIKQDNKLYVRDKDRLIGVSVYLDNVLKVKGSETDLREYEELTVYEVYRKFNIDVEPYVFPKSKKGVSNGTTSKTKKLSGKSE